MIRNTWIAVSTIAVANLVAFMGLAVWLQVTERLTPERLEAVRLVFAQSLSEEQQAEAAEVIQAERDAQAAIEAARVGSAPITAEERLRLLQDNDEVMRQRYERYLRQTRDLEATISAELARLEQERKDFQAEKKAFEEMRAEIIRREGSEQFEKSVATYQSLKPEQAREMLQVLIDRGEIEQVVGYLNAMQSRAATRIIAEFEKDNTILAAELLERLRTYGVQAIDPEE